MNYFKQYLEVAPLSLAIWRSLEARAISKIKLKSPVLDIGCGFGEFAGVFFDSFVEVGVDISQADLIMASRKKKYKKLIRADARNLPFKNNKFNSVLSVSSLEHIKNVEQVFEESHRVLKPGGLLVFTAHSLTLNRSLILPFGRESFMKLYHFFFKHYINQEKSDWIKMVKKAGFEIMETKGTISKRQLLLFQMTLPLAIPSQITRLLFKKRFILGKKMRTKFLYRLFMPFLEEDNPIDANFLVVARKPK